MNLAPPSHLVGKPLFELTHPLRSPLITSGSSLLRDDPPSPCASILSPFVNHTYRVFSSHHRESSHVPAKSLDQRHAISTPDTAQPRHRLPLNCSQATKQDPVLMSSNLLSMLRQWFTCVRLTGPYVTFFFSLMPFPQRSPPGLSTQAA